MFPLANFAASLMFAAGCGLLAAILLRRTYKRLGRRRRNTPAIDAQPRPETAWSGAQGDASARIARQEVELHDRARDVTGQIDSKLILLRELIAQSESQIERLEALLEQTRECETPSDER